MTEVELKYEVTDFDDIKMKLANLGGKVLVESKFEQNIVLDAPDQFLRKEGKLLRLRSYNDKVILTVKETVPSETMKIRLEHESNLSMSFEEATHLFTLLNFKEVFRYEKKREIWQFNSIHICLDSLSFGNFVEIEAQSPDEVRSISQALGLDIAKGIKSSYRTLQIRAEKGKFVKS